MSSNATHTAMTGTSGDIATGTTPTSVVKTQAAIPGLPDHLVVAHMIRSEYFDDPADLARLPAVSHAMNDAVAATGRQFKELDARKAMQLGCLSAVERLQRRGILQHQEYLCHAAARSGQLEELKLLRENDCPWDDETCSGAARGGHLELLQWARANGCPWDETMCEWAAIGGQLEVLQWAHANGCPWNAGTCMCAAGGGYLEVLQWLRANGCPWDGRTCRFAAFYGHLELLQWAHANGCPWDEATCHYAVKEEHLDILQFARANGCPWTAGTRDRAEALGYINNDRDSCV